jgi:hypothetical protein
MAVEEFDSSNSTAGVFYLNNKPYFTKENPVESFVDLLKRQRIDLEHKAAKPREISLNLSPTPLSYFPEEELIIFLNDRLYYLSISSATQNLSKISMGGTVNLKGVVYCLNPSLEDSTGYSLICSESFVDLEREFFIRNKKEIDSFKQSYIEQLAQEDFTLGERYDSLAKSLNDDSLDSLIKNYFFPITKGIDLEKIISENKKRELFEKRFDVNKIKDIHFGYKTSFFQEILANKDAPLLITGGEFYSLSPKISFLDNTRNMEKKYKHLILRKIKENIKSNVSDYFRDLSEKDQGLKELSNGISHATSGAHKDFGAERISEYEYVLFKNTGQYGVEWKGEFYLFPSAKVGVSVVKNSNGFQIDESAFVYQDPDYKHPYVYLDGTERQRICTAGRLSIIHRQIGLDSTSSRDKTKLMTSAKRLLESFDGILKAGHNSDHVPQTSIPESARLISRSEAEYYKKRGVVFFPKTIW